MADDYSGDTSTTGTTGAAGWATGDIETSGDADWFAVTLTGGVAYQFDVQGAQSGRGTLVHSFVRLRDTWFVNGLSVAAAGATGPTNPGDAWHIITTAT